MYGAGGGGGGFETVPFVTDVAEPCKDSCDDGPGGKLFPIMFCCC